jgi:hypothetical protein
MKRQTAFRFDMQLLDKLRELALKENRSLNNFIETILKEYIKNKIL